jgi:hypothetical protein
MTVAFVAGSLVFVGLPAVSTAASTSNVLRVDHVADGDTVDLTNGVRIRLVRSTHQRSTSIPSATAGKRPR